MSAGSLDTEQSDSLSDGTVTDNNTFDRLHRGLNWNQRSANGSR